MRPAGAALALVFALSLPSPRSWLGTDKLKHFVMSAFVHSAAHSLARTAGGRRVASQSVGLGTAAVVGVLKEVRDRRTGGPFSVPDLAWDAAGALSMAALLNRSR